MIQTIRYWLPSFLCAAILCIGTLVFAQHTPSTIGIITGVNFTSFDEGRYNNYDFFIPGTGYFLGLSYDSGLGSNLEINIEGHFSRRIIKEKYLTEDDPFYDYSISDFRIICTHLSFPVSLNYAIDRLGLQAGIFNDILLSKSYNGQRINPELTILDGKKKYDAGLIIGGHYDFYNLEIGIRKYFGWVNQEKLPVTDGYIDEEISLYKTDQLQFFIKYNL